MANKQIRFEVGVFGKTLIILYIFGTLDQSVLAKRVLLLLSTNFIFSEKIRLRMINIHFFQYDFLENFLRGFFFSFRIDTAFFYTTTA